MAEEKILTKHPLGKSGKNISKQKYDTLKKAILSALKNRQLTHTELFSELNKSLRSKFSGNISWYGETVKLDLEAKKNDRKNVFKAAKIPAEINAIIMKTEGTHYGVTQIAQLFPSLKRIKDKSLREKVAAVWNEAITTGCGGKGWTFDELRAVKFTLLAGDIDMTFVEHLNSCARQCIAIADVLEKSFRCGIPIQRDYLIAGALLADVGKPLEYDKDALGQSDSGKIRTASASSVQRRRARVQTWHSRRSPAHHRHAQSRRRQGRALDRVDHFPSRRFRGLRYRKAAWQAAAKK